VAALDGWRLAASGLPHAYLNVGCVVDPAIAEPDRASEWFRTRGLPWSALLPSGCPWPHGPAIVTLRLMAMQAVTLPKSSPVPGLVLRRASGSTEDIEAAAVVDAASFDADYDETRRWIEPHFGRDEVRVAIGELDGVAVATGFSLRCDGEAGRTVYLGGIGVVEAARRRGIAGALSSWLLVRGFEEGARFAHLHTESDGAARVYARLGLLELNGIDVYAGN
jgi:ribosomal protein S18 acetylase RimI-like enzyme